MPLKIISANADVLELVHGPDEWILSICNQTAPLDRLVKDPLTLSRLEENGYVVFSEFFIDKIVTEAVAAFQPLIQSKNYTLRMDVENGVSINGNQEGCRQMIEILLDYAVKYTPVGGCI